MKTFDNKIKNKKDLTNFFNKHRIKGVYEGVYTSFINKFDFYAYAQYPDNEAMILSDFNIHYREY